MVGTLPPTKLLLTKNNLVLGVFNRYYEVGIFVGVSVDKKGNVFLRGEPRSPSYVMKGQDPNVLRNGFIETEVIGDWAKYYLPKEPDYNLYRILV
jgi:hypothetical protein